MYFARPMNENHPSGSTLTRWLDRGATLRVATVDVGETARAICLLHDASGEDARNLSQAVAGALLLASDLKSEQTLSLQLELGAKVFHVDATADGLVRAMPATRAHHSTVARVAARRFGRTGLLYQSVVDVPSGSVAGVLEGFEVQSEQQIVRLELVCDLDEQGLPAAAFGAILRGFPATTAEDLAGLFESWVRRGRWAPSDPCRDLAGRTWDRLTTTDVRHFCPCSRERALSSVRALGEDALEDAARKGEPMEVVCDFCRSAYVFEVDEFRPSAGG